jgi:hypothetical protein
MNPKLTRLYCNVKTLPILILRKEVSYASSHQVVDICIRIRHVVGMLYSKNYNGYRRYGDIRVTVVATRCARAYRGGLNKLHPLGHGYGGHHSPAATACGEWLAGVYPLLVGPMDPSLATDNVYQSHRKGCHEKLHSRFRASCRTTLLAPDLRRGIRHGIAMAAAIRYQSRHPRS